MCRHVAYAGRHDFLRTYLFDKAGELKISATLENLLITPEILSHVVEFVLSFGRYL